MFNKVLDSSVLRQSYQIIASKNLRKSQIKTKCGAVDVCERFACAYEWSEQKRNVSTRHEWEKKTQAIVHQMLGTAKKALNGHTEDWYDYLKVWMTKKDVLVWHGKHIKSTGKRLNLTSCPFKALLLFATLQHEHKFQATSSWLKFCRKNGRKLNALELRHAGTIIRVMKGAIFRPKSLT